MTASPATHLPLSPPMRRHSDPPGLWVVVVGASLVFNGAIALSLYHYVLHIEPEATDTAPIAVTFMSSRPTSKSGSQASAIGSKPPLASTATSAPTQSHTPRLTLSPQTNSAPIPPTKPTPTPDPPRPQTTQTTATPSPSQPAQPAARPPQPAASHTDSDRSESSPPTAASMTEPDPPPATDLPSNSNLATSTRRLPDFTVPPDPTVNTSASQSEITDTLAINRRVLPVQMSMYVKLHSPEPTLTASTQLMATEQTKTVVSGDAGCVVTPAALQSFGQSVDFAVQLNSQGAVLETNPLPASRDNSSPSYQELVACFLKSWTFAAPSRFSSATEAGSPQFRVTVTLEKH